MFLFEPLLTLAASILNNADALSAPAVGSTMNAFALLLLFSAFVLVARLLPGEAAAAPLPRGMR